MTFPDWLAAPARGTEIALIILVPCFILLAWQKDLVMRFLIWGIRFIPKRRREWLLREAHFAMDSLESVRRPGLLAGLIFWSLVVGFSSALTNYLVFLAFGITLPYWAALLLLVVMQVGTQIPSSWGSGNFSIPDHPDTFLFWHRKEFGFGLQHSSLPGRLCANCVGRWYWPLE